MSSRKLHKALEISQALLVVELATARLISSVLAEIRFHNENQFPPRHLWNQMAKREDELSAAVELDMHSVVVTCTQLVKLLDGSSSEFRNGLSKTTKEHIKLLRDHYEHWDLMKQFFVVREGMNRPVPKPGEKAALYLERYATSPKGNMSIEYDRSGEVPTVSRVIIGGSFEPFELRDELATFRKVVDQIIDDSRSALSLQSQD